MSMPKFFNLLSLSVFFLFFSGKPLPLQLKAVHVVISVLNAKPVETAEYIPWLDERLLIWDDFQCAPKKNTDAIASTSTSLGIAYQVRNGTLTYAVTCNFSKTKSWGWVKTDYILAHEQAHFDITEIYARMLHQAMQEYQYNHRTYKEDLNNIYNKIVWEKEAFQNAYDHGTDHSRKKRLQLEWLEKIEELLEETQPYADYP